ncbi:Krueppel-like factor 11 [Fusarium oxysporum f. sp. cubense]|uniref:Krueppel-like factor 11 n=1 Tax=Fusarium oxysporum f. sp. cubense TaxID=61366 RepID=A0A559KRH7_FUSOC|nr:Krueppel-like factor 11 [Fusarium oxysporum f. sp. cubense]
MFLATQNDTGDPDGVAPQSPKLEPLYLRLQESSPSPPPLIPTTKASRNSKFYKNSGYANLINNLDGGRNPDIAREVDRENLPCDEDSPDEESWRDSAVDGNLAADALPINGLSARGYISGSKVTSPLIPSSNGALPPLHHGVRALAGKSKETLPSQSLPSLRSTLGELRDLPPERPSEQDLGRSRPGPSSTFPPSPAANLGHKFSLTTNLPSSPRSAPDRYRTLSSHSTAEGSIDYEPANGTHARATTEYSSSNATGTPNTDHSASSPAASVSINSTSITDRMSIDGMTHPQPITGLYTCTVQGCHVEPFQTQYLLNSHMNVHSSVRPHYCPVKGCPRSEGGKGFKRKNEMVRHGLVHDSPGYVCPFCPDREHKYPRPDNLQRHVRVHHIDKDRDDPQLRAVLAQRPDGPNRDRRSRNPPS